MPLILAMTTHDQVVVTTRSGETIKFNMLERRGRSTRISVDAEKGIVISKINSTPKNPSTQINKISSH